MFDCQNFVSQKKNILIAPAGYGKTHTIAECIKHTPDGEKQLILTHTHAGIASIKDKIKKQQNPNSKYHIETITGFAQKYVIAIYSGKAIPEQEKTKEYFPFIIKKATELFNYKSILRVVSLTYDGLFVDEYQDCTKLQHQMILALSKILSTHIFGDPLQGIMNFNGDLVDFEQDLNDFTQVKELNTPYRWYTDGNNRYLGDALKEIRGNLLEEKSKIVDLSKYDEKVLYCIKIDENDLFNNRSIYRRSIDKLILNPEKQQDFENLLILVPEYDKNGVQKGSISDRARLRARIDYARRLFLLEAIDDKTFYSLARKIDTLLESIQHRRKKINGIKSDVLVPLFNKGCIDKWFADDRLIAKQKEKEVKSKKLDKIISKFISEPSIISFMNILVFLKNELKFKCKRDGLYWSVIKALNTASTENINVYEGMLLHKNTIRRVGRKIYGKCLGTTALTKGLEFDTVAILNAHNFQCPKNLYVALTRASKRLIVFTESKKLIFN